jgi:hypothetical protein
MWISGIGEMEDISRCFIYFRQFHFDFEILISSGVIKRVSYDHYDWTKSITSLAEYFKWIGNTISNVEGGFWAPIAKTLTVKGKPVTQRQLSRLAGGNANLLKPEESRDFKKIKMFVKEYRKAVQEQEKQNQEDMKTFNAIKKLVDKDENNDIKKIRAALKKIKIILG